MRDVLSKTACRWLRYRCGSRQIRKWRRNNTVLIAWLLF